MASGQALFWLWLPSPLLCSVGCHRRRSLQGWRVFLLATLSSTFSTISSGWPTQTRFQIGTWVFLLLLVSLGPACAMMLKFVVSCERFGWLRLTDCKVSSLFYSDSSCSFLAKHSNPYYFSNHCRGHFTRVVLIRQQVTKTDGHFIVAGHNRWYFLLKYGASLRGQLPAYFPCPLISLRWDRSHCWSGTRIHGILISQLQLQVCLTV